MSLVKVLLQEMENNYQVTEKLFRLVEPAQLGWKPATGSNWMTVGQLLMHCSSGCGVAARAFVTGDWGLPDGVNIKDIPPEEMLPPAEKLPTAESVDQALRLLAEDREVAIATLNGLDDAELLNKRFSAPWGGVEFTLFQHILHMINHLGQHKGQLYYYLKLLGKDVRTGDLWGNV
ncbi:MAG: DinB family protein [Acidobacteria bacterium]|nr:MAG: DinB family protein [Acidobacteriota bacterium]